MRIVIGCDHAGYALKRSLIDLLESEGHEVRDVGAYDTEASDYPPYALAVAEAVSRGEAERGIFTCGSGMGPAIIANKVPGIRAVACSHELTAVSSRRDQNSNVLTLGERLVGPGLAQAIVLAWLHEPFSGAPRHQRRLDQLLAAEQKYCRPPSDAEPQRH